MLISHNKKISDNVEEEVGFLLTNRNGSFFNTGISSIYSGLFFADNKDIIKLIEEIKTPGKVTEIKNNFWNIQRNKENIHESFFMPVYKDALVYELSNKDTIDIFLDVKKAYDNRKWGRIYEIWQEGDRIIIYFTKKTDSREDDSNGLEEYSIFIVIALSKGSDIQILDTWQQREYSFDKNRNYPSDRFVFNALRLKAKKLVITFSKDKDTAIQNCDDIILNLDKLKANQKKSLKLNLKKYRNKKIELAQKNAMLALTNLEVKKEENIYAGLPWFFQFWSRDTFISLKALMLNKEFDLVHKIFMEYMHHIQEDGLLSNQIPKSLIASADSIGWFFKRLDDFFPRHKKFFKKTELSLLKTKLSETVDDLFRNYTHENLATNNKQETWMDSIARDGKRLEIQALRIVIFNFMFKLTKNTVYKDMAEKIIKYTKENFWNGLYLRDGIDDDTIRPNIFIAAYLCPEILKKEEWLRCFDTILPKLWLNWGGLSTIDTSNSKFHSKTTGQDSSSYHNGDSWYWINNLAALVLCRTDYSHYKKIVDKIIDASSDDILFKGFIGCHSEISSASTKESNGCLSQAWSNAFFVELVQEIIKS